MPSSGSCCAGCAWSSTLRRARPLPLPGAGRRRQGPDTHVDDIAGDHIAIVHRAAEERCRTGQGRQGIAGRGGRHARRCTPRCWPACSRTSDCARSPAASTRAPGASASSSGRDRRWRGPARSWWWPPNWSRPAGSGAGSAPGSNPAWVEQVGGDLLRRSYSEPRWNAKRASVEATEKVMLLGVTAGRRAHRAVRPDRSGTVPGTVHPACPGGAGLDDPAPLLHPEPAGPGRRRRLGGPHQTPGHRGRRRDAVRAV